MHGDINRTKIIGRKYRVLELLGSGGFGSVYRVLDKHLDKTYAMKIQPIMQRSDWEKEICMLRMLNHPGLPALHDVITDEYNSYIVMEHIKGMTLENHVKEKGKLELKEALQIAMGLCAIIDYLHHRSVPVIHGDLKPGNIMMEAGRIRLIDFGCALRAYSEEKADYGTPEYAAPEQHSGEISTASDVYSWGKVMMFMITGRQDNVVEIKRLNKKLKTYGIPRRIRKIVIKCLQPQVKMRYPSAGELREELQKIKTVKRHLPGMTAGYVGSILRLIGLGMLIYCIFCYRYGSLWGCNSGPEDDLLKELFLRSLLIFLSAIPWDAIARTFYKTAILECECNILVTEGSCKYI